MEPRGDPIDLKIAMLVRKLDGRLSQIAKRMKQLAWVEDHVVVITDE